MIRPGPFAAIACLVVLLSSGCGANRFGGNGLSERTFGDAVRAAIARQTLNPAASQNSTDASGHRHEDYRPLEQGPRAR